MTRPLMQHGVGQPQELFTQKKTDQKLLRQLERELSHRQVPRAVLLLEEVRRALRAIPSVEESGDTVPATHITPASEQPAQDMRFVGTEPEEFTTSPGGETTSRPPRKAFARKDSPKDADLGAMALDVALKTLRAAPGAPWESVELARRQIVQLASPASAGQLSPESRESLRSAARRANFAYSMLWKARTGR